MLGTNVGKKVTANLVQDQYNAFLKNKDHKNVVKKPQMTAEERKMAKREEMRKRGIMVKADDKDEAPTIIEKGDDEFVVEVKLEIEEAEYSNFEVKMEIEENEEAEYPGILKKVKIAPNTPEEAENDSDSDENPEDAEIGLKIDELRVPKIEEESPEAAPKSSKFRIK
ncbi:unnamed protein product [Caenorhabditis angaria]|uniref:Uncharacterized protein n=1 Tax=Caenorhabditis angaria TaxID=860376 RepID=A0A9P1IEQ3_9PELO|nr:unnamed protein product [Caenorhabditis angaria]